MKRLLAAIGIAFIALSLSTLNGTEPVKAANGICAFYPYCYSVLQNHENYGNIDRMMMDTQLLTMYRGSSAHMNNSLWMKSNGVILEIGECTGSAASGCQGLVAGAQNEYVAINGTIKWWRTINADGSTHNFKFSSNSGTWYFYVDAAQVYTYYTGSSFGNANTSSTGGEMVCQLAQNYCPDSTQYTVGTFSNHVQEHYAQGAWHNWSSYGSFVDIPCGTNNCFNGTIPSQSIWNWNKVA